MTILRLENIHKVYRDGEKELCVLKGINLTVEKEEVLAVTGPSGAGKSTLLHIIGGIDMPNKGKVFLDNTDVYSLEDKLRAKLRNQKIGFVFQFYHLLPEFNIIENVMLPALINGVASRSRAEFLLKQVGLESRFTHRPNELSGGEQQRTAIARALMNNPEVLLCDEPTGNLDSAMGEEILKILFDLNRNNHTTVVIVTHDRDITKKVHRIIEMKDGMVSL